MTSKMPEAVAFRFLSRAASGFAWSSWLPIAELNHYDAQGNLRPGPGPGWEKVEYLHDGRACYLAGLEAARQAVPDEVVSRAADENEAGRIAGHNGLRDRILSSLERMKTEATKWK